MRKKLAKQIVKKRFRRIHRGIIHYQFVNLSKQYLHFLQSVPHKLLIENGVNISVWEKHLPKIKENLRQRKLRQEDAVLFFFLLRRVYPISVRQKARYIFIDEMQDFAPAQVALLQAIYPKANLTFCGDLNQNVFGNETITDFLDQLFKDQEVTRFQLTTSYRSTKEITDFANHFLSKENQVETTARKGNLPLLIQGKTFESRLSWLSKILDTTQEKTRYWRTAIIGKTQTACEELYERLPAFLAKGLEFDCVFLWDIDDSNFVTDQDKLVLYTMCTRAMHELILVTSEMESPLLKTMDPSFYKKINL